MITKYLIVGAFMVLLFFCAVVYVYVKELHEKQNKVKSLQREILDLTEQIDQSERRDAFRLEAEDLKCDFHIVQINNRNANSIIGKKGEGTIKNLSFTGLQLETALDLPVKSSIKLQLSFELHQNLVTLNGLVMRKEIHVQRSSYIYGIKFVEPNRKKKSKFNRLLRYEELKSRRMHIE